MRKNYSDLTATDILALAESDILDDNQLAARIARRLTLSIKAQLGTITDDECVMLGNLVYVTDGRLARRFEAAHPLGRAN